MIQALPAPAASAPFDPEEQRRWDEALRLAELWLAPATTLSGEVVSAKPLRRADWAEAALKALPHDRAGGGPPRERGRRRRRRRPRSPPMVSRLGSLLYGIQLGGAVGQLARTLSAHYDVLLPAPGRGAIPVLRENVAAFEQAAGIPGDQLRLWIAAGQLARRRVVEGADWLVGHLAALLEQVAAATDPGRPAWPTTSRAST